MSNPHKHRAAEVILKAKRDPGYRNLLKAPVPDPLPGSLVNEMRDFHNREKGYPQQKIKRIGA